MNEQANRLQAAQDKLSRERRRAEWKELRPIVRSVAAFLMGLRYGLTTQDTYVAADEYLAEFEKDADLK